MDKLQGFSQRNISSGVFKKLRDIFPFGKSWYKTGWQGDSGQGDSKTRFFWRHAHRIHRRKAARSRRGKHGQPFLQNTPDHSRAERMNDKEVNKWICYYNSMKQRLIVWTITKRLTKISSTMRQRGSQKSFDSTKNQNRFFFEVHVFFTGFLRIPPYLSDLGRDRRE